MGSGLFRPARHRWLAEIITFESPAMARAAARKLLNIMVRRRRGTRRIGRKTALEIYRALVYAANRARASARRRNLSSQEKKQLLEIARIYRAAARRAARIYREKYREKN